MNQYDPPSTRPERVLPELSGEDEQQHNILTHLAITIAVIDGVGLLYILFVA